MLPNFVKSKFMPVAVVVIVVILFLFYTTAGQDLMGGGIDSDAPQNILTITVTDTSTGTTITGDIDLDKPSSTQTFLWGGGFQLTSFTQELFGIVAVNPYTIDFEVVSTVNPKEGVTIADEDLTGICLITGQSPTNAVGQDEAGWIYYGNFAGTSWNAEAESTQTFKIGDSTTYTFPSTETYDSMYFQPTDHSSITGDTPNTIMGVNLHGSTFNIGLEVRDVATGGLTYFGTTTADITFNVNPEGNLEVIVENVVGSVTGG